MFEELMAIFGKNPSGKGMDKDAAARVVRSKQAMKAFEESYRKSAMAQTKYSTNSFEVNSRDASEAVRTTAQELVYDEAQVKDVVDRAVNELVLQTHPVMTCIDGIASTTKLLKSADEVRSPLTNEDIKALPKEVRPQLTGELVSYDIDPVMSRTILVPMLEDALDTSKKPKQRELAYARFRQGLDILDIDPVMYEMLGRNKNSMSYWLPSISFATTQEGFFKIPQTRIAKVPLPILQLTRVEYGSLTPSTLKIVDDWATRAFDLDVNKSYFIKTGCYSSKFDFRNCKVTGEKEVRELGEYLLYIHQQANYMAGPLTRPCPVIGASTTNEWVVREFIEDVEDNPTIYKGLPLHTEYRVFVDFDTKEILGYTPYWHPEGMKKHFGKDAEKNPHMYHDYVVYSAHEETLMRRYNENVDKVVNHVKAMLPLVNMLEGQWSIDIMQNGDDFWLIDMALACQSALSECVPAGKIHNVMDEWLSQSEMKAILDEDSKRLAELFGDDNKQEEANTTDT